MEQMEKEVKIAVPLKNLSNFWRSLKMFLINCEVEFSLSSTEIFVLSGGENINNAGAVTKAVTKTILKITDAKLYIPVGTLSTEEMQI